MEKEVLIFGHKIPDTDSVISAITLSYLKNALGVKAIPRVLGELNKESKFVLDYFKVNHPMYLNDVKCKIKHSNYQSDHIVADNTCILECFEYMDKTGVRSLPVVDNDQKLKGLISMKDISNFLINGETSSLMANFDDIIYCTKAISDNVNMVDEVIKGKLVVASYDLNKILSDNSLTKDSILVVGNRLEVIDHALEVGVKMLVLTGGTILTDAQNKIVQEKKINLITTTMDTYMTSNKIILANLIEQFITTEDIISVSNNMYVDDFIQLTKSHKYKNYPVIGKNDECLGLVSLIHIVNVNKKDVILVDHNELGQSADGIKEANILEVVDHHNIGSISTAGPITFTTMPVGCTNTIIYNMYKDNNVEIPKDIAGLMMCAIISDTLNLKSPTTTNKDKETLMALIEYVGIDQDKFVNEMFKAGTSLDGMSIEDIVNVDIKEMDINENKIIIGQVMTMDIDGVLDKKDEVVEHLNSMVKKNKYKVAALFITDIINESSYVIYSDNSDSVLKGAFSLNEIKQGVKLEGLVSRKKQIIPNLIYILDK